MSETIHPAPATLGQLRASGYEPRGVKEELRANLLARLRTGQTAFPGIVGFDDSVLPELEGAILAGHDLVLLGERGQGKTRLMRTLVQLLDEWSPDVTGCEIHDDPYAPVCVRCRALAVEVGDDLPISWRHRDDRYTEKLATPDTSVGDLIGDVDPVKVAQGRTLGDPETVHYGLVPRANRGLFGLNELPDLAERIQVALFNVLEERDIQVRGYSLRLPLDLFLVATANPEDYTNRGRIITPLKDRFGAEIRTHYLAELEDEISLLRQEAHAVAAVDDHLLEVIARFTRNLRDSSSVDQRSGVSARFAIAAAEAVSGSALRRSARTGDSDAVARVCDLEVVLPTLMGKIEFEMGEEGREAAVLDHLLRMAVAASFRERLAGLDLSGFTAVFNAGAVVETGELVPATDLLAQLGTVPGLSKVLSRLGYDDAATRGQVAAAAEFTLEGLHLTRRIERDSVDGRTVYGRRDDQKGDDPLGPPRRAQALSQGDDPLEPPQLLGHTGARPMTAEPYEPGDRSRDRYHRRFRYGPWRGGPDPLAPPYDVRAAMDQIGNDVLSAGNLRDSLRDLMARGVDGRGGLDRLADKIRKLRAAARRRGDLGGTLDQVRAALDQAMAAERETLAGTEGDDARFAEMELDTVPDDVAGAVRALDQYPWRSDEAKQIFESIKQMLQREVLDAQFAGMKQALESPDPEAMQRVKDMLADLNALLAAHARQEDTTDQFADFMDKHGEFFPEQPETIEELIDALARRQAAAQRMLASLSPEQREQLSQLMSQALADADLASEMAQLSDNLRALRPGMDRNSPAGMRPGGESLGYSEAVEAVAELADLEALEAQLSQTDPGSTLDDVDVEMLEQRLGHEAVRDFTALRDLERELERQGYLTRGDDGLRLTPRAVRRLGQTALKRVFDQIAATGHGDHEDHRTGAADEPTGLTRPWVFGDELPIDTPRTVANALRRRSTGGPSSSSGNVLLDVEDFEVTETERRTSAAVALCVDLSFSMVQDGRWGPMKQTALALNHLIETRFRQDALQVIGFNRLARKLSPVQLAEAEPEWVQGTNLQHALIIAARHLRRHPDAEPVVLVVTDGEPTAHLTGDGTAFFRWPSTSETVRATVAQIDELTRYGATINTFMLGDDEGLARFMDAIARRSGGRVFTPDIGRLGEYVVADYLKARRGRR